MWPWEHLAVGYVCYSLYCHVRHGRAPTGREALAVAFATQFPDLVDKTLAWGLHVLPSGQSLAHSLFVAVPLSLLVVVFAWRRGRSPLGVAFGVGYLSHLPGDVLWPYLTGGPLATSFLLWPLRSGPPADPSRGLLETVSYYVTNYAHEIASGELTGYVLLQLAFLSAVFLLWLFDGAPVLAELGTFARADGRGDAFDGSSK